MKITMFNNLLSFFKHVLCGPDFVAYNQNKRANAVLAKFVQD